MGPILQRGPTEAQTSEPTISRSHSQLGMEQAFKPRPLNCLSPSSVYCPPPPLVSRLGMSP